MHTCSIQSKTTQKNSRKHLEEQKLEVRNNSKSTQLNSGKNSCTGYTGGPAPAHPKATGYTGALASFHPDSAAGIRSWKTQHHRLHRCPLDKHWSIHHVILQRPCFLAWESFYFTGYTGGLTLAMIRGSALETKETLQHRLHRCLLGTFTDALLSDCHSVRMSTATIWF